MGYIGEKINFCIKYLSLLICFQDNYLSLLFQNILF